MQKPVAFHALSLGEKLVPVFIVVMHFSPSATLIVSILLLIAWLGTGECKHAIADLGQAPIARSGLLLFVLLALSALYSAAPWAKAFGTLAKYRELLLPWLLMPFLRSEPSRRRCEMALLTTLFASLLISSAGYWHWLPATWVNDILKNRITHSLFMAFLGFYSLHQLYRAQARRWLWGVALAWVALNLFVMSNGRTGQVVFLGLGAMFVFQHFERKTALYLSVTLLAAFAAFLWLSPYASRFWEGIHESAAFFEHSEQLQRTSMGERLHFWSSALHIIQQSPWLGEGVGGFAYAFHQAFPAERILANPHNEFLLMTAQLGLPGLCVFLVFLGVMLKQAFAVHDLHRHLLQGIVLMLIISCLFNSSILDHTEGHWFMTVIALFGASLNEQRSSLAPESGESSSLRIKTV